MLKPFNSRVRVTILFACLLILCSSVYPDFGIAESGKARQYQILIHAGELDQTIENFKEIDFWGEKKHSQDLTVPRIIVAVQSDRWAEQSAGIEVSTKKELFYRALLPMILMSNELILAERREIEEIRDNIESGKDISLEQQARIKTFAQEYRLDVNTDINELLTQLLRRVDSIPASLALGQAAYESGYGTSRFAREGNAFFGMWTYSGDGMTPKEHRASKGNYGVAAYLWPFDSVKSYMLNLNTHTAYEALRLKRAELREQSRQPSGLDLAPTLENYSEKGVEYVNTLTGIIKTNQLDIADNARLRDEPITLAVGVKSAEKIAEVEMRIEELRASGELDQIIEEMKLQ